MLIAERHPEESHSIFSSNMDPRRIFFCPSAPWSESLPAAEKLWPRLLHTPFPVVATDALAATGVEETATEDNKVKTKKKKKKKEMPLSDGCQKALV